MGHFPLSCHNIRTTITKRPGHVKRTTCVRVVLECDWLVHKFVAHNNYLEVDDFLNHMDVNGNRSGIADCILGKHAGRTPVCQNKSYPSSW